MKIKGIFALLALSIVAGTAQASIIYKWTTPDGVPHIGDNMPPSEVKYGYSVVDTKSGETVETVPPEQEHKQSVEAAPPAAKVNTKPEQEATAVAPKQANSSPERTKQLLEANQREIDGVMKQINGLTAINMTPYHRAKKMAELQAQMIKLQQERLAIEPSNWDMAGQTKRSEAE
jgi:hypothetical protein